MTDAIQIVEPIKKVEASLVPMHIQYTGEANTKDYFTPSKSIEKYGKDTVDTAYFRGCKLIGKKVDLSNSYKGFLINSSEQIVRIENNNGNEVEDGYNYSNEENDDFKTVKTYTTIASFDSINIYGHDSVPESTSQWMLVNEWKNVSDIIHG